MFTGLIEDLGQLVSRQQDGAGWKLVVRTGLPTREIAVGDSIAVNGACLTVEDIQGDTLGFHTLAETLERTNLHQADSGASVNLERSMKANGRFGGHFVAGHVDETAAIKALGRKGADWTVRIGLSDELKPLVIPKGSIAVNGISLTIATLHESDVSICIIPHTWRVTNLHLLQVGDMVNLEADMIGKYVQRQLESSRSPALTADRLAQAGFLPREGSRSM